MSDKPSFIPYETVICNDFLDPVATAVWDALGEPETAEDVLLYIGAVPQNSFDLHIANTSNPHAVTAAQVGAVTDIQAGTNITVDATDPRRPIVSAPSASGITDIVQDTTPQLGGNLDMNGFNINTGTYNITPTVLGYLNGVSSNIQTQLTGKIAISSPQLGGNLNMNGYNIYTGVYNLTPTVLGYLNGVSSNIQTQLNAKLSAASPVLAGNLNLSSYGIQATAGLVSNTVFGYLYGVTSPIQTQINSKISSLSADSTPTLNNYLSLNGQNIFTGNNYVTPAMIDWLADFTSNPQTQIDGKLSTSGGTISGNLAISGSTELTLTSTATEGAGITFYKNGGAGYVLIDQKWDLTPKSLRFSITDGSITGTFYAQADGVFNATKLGLRTTTTGGAYCAGFYGYGASGNQWGSNYQAGNDYGPVHLRFINAAGTQVGAITSTSSTTSYTTSSDRRLKKNIKNFSKKGLDIIKNVLPREFIWKHDNSEGIGFIADELMDIIPEAVTGKIDEIDPEGNPIIQGIDYSKLVPYLVHAIQELTERLQTIEKSLQPQ